MAYAARRRRERRLRSWWRQEQQSVRMALYAAAHHSAVKVAAGGKDSGLQTQTTFSAGRPGVLTEPEPQGSGSHGRVRGCPGAVAGRAAAGAAGEAVDSSSLRYLTAATLRQREEEERQELEELEEAKERADEMKSLLAAPRALWTPAQLCRFEELAARSSDSWASLRRKRKKRRKRKLPNSSSSGCRRPCDCQRQVPAVRIPVVTQRQVPTVHSFMLPVQFLDKGHARCGTTTGAWFDGAENWAALQLHFIDGRRLSLFVPQRQISRLFSRSQRLSSCCSISGGRCPCCACRAVSPVLPWRRSWRSHSCSSLRNRRSWYSDCIKLRIFRSCSSSRSLSSCRDSEAHPHGPCVHGDSPVAL